MVLARKSRVMNFAIYELSRTVGVADYHQVQLLCISLQGVLKGFVMQVLCTTQRYRRVKCIPFQDRYLRNQ
jgi:hypothetical protein